MSILAFTILISDVIGLCNSAYSAVNFTNRFRIIQQFSKTVIKTYIKLWKPCFRKFLICSPNFIAAITAYLFKFCCSLLIQVAPFILCGGYSAPKCFRKLIQITYVSLVGTSLFGCWGNWTQAITGEMITACFIWSVPCLHINGFKASFYASESKGYFDTDAIILFPIHLKWISRIIKIRSGMRYACPQHN